MFGVLPIATSTKSGSKISPFESVTFLFSIFSTVVESFKPILRILNNLSTYFETSSSAIERTFPVASTTVTSTSMSLKILAHSIPSAPAPIITTLFGASFISNKSSEFKINLWSYSKPLSAFGSEPVAIIIFSQK